ncbi:geranyl diphosphate 2-C-methyltransferase [Kitasatospora sp. LaBMicrA B282]|uniref:geranyl diphosphate 2-C-methyltransferase n=1 Tax=Kitasatospora sp. LaBMicrA B282 TaxID=3420949 RepID=UPI003D0EFC82
MSITENTGPATAYQGDIARYWNEEERPVNLRLGEVDGLFHHHYGIGSADFTVLAGDDAGREQRIINELHRLETAQADLLLDHLGDLTEQDAILDAGCGRGGTSLMAHQRFGCGVTGVSLSTKQVAFANQRAADLDVHHRVRYHVRNMLDTGLDTGSLAASWNNESSMYVDLNDLFAEHARVLRHGGRYVVITGCYNEVYGQPSKAVSLINAEYECNCHGRREYFQAMANNRLVPAYVEDLTPLAIPYWELRSVAGVATGIEEAFLNGYKDGSFQYLLIAADRV